MTTQIDLATLPASKLTKQQVEQYGPREFMDNGRKCRITAHVRYDDQCGNGYNSFGVTADIDEQHGSHWVDFAGGCCHDEIAKYFPELAPMLKWHLCSSDGPMHYLANAKYWAGHDGWRDGKPNSPPDLDNLKSTIVYGALPEDAQFDLADCLYSDQRGFTWNEAKAHALERWLVARLPRLMEQFKAAVESLGFTY